jgi:hypothetical protein
MEVEYDRILEGEKELQVTVPRVLWLKVKKVLLHN